VVAAAVDGMVSVGGDVVARTPAVCTVVVPVRVMAVPSNFALIVFPAVKPDPLSDTLVPNGPVEGLSVIDAGERTVNVAGALLPDASVTTTLYAPALLEDGTVNVTPLTEPPLPEVAPLLRESADPPNVALRAEDAAKPSPDTATPVSPAGPDEGLREISGFTVKVAE
jgi:hypothetical protein